MSYIITFRSLTYAQKAAKILENSGLSAFIIKVPERISSHGCSYGIRISEKSLIDVMVVLKANSFQPIKIFVRQKNGTFSEVENDIS